MEFALKYNQSKNLIVLLLMLVAISSTGCRQAPSEEPKYYKKELVAIQKEEARKAAEKAEKNKKYMPDGYPWRGTKAREHLYCVPCRTEISDKYLSAKIEYLSEAVHGKRKSRIKFRD